jgi:membrane protein DedA with SNARE-associated domain
VQHLVDLIAWIEPHAILLALFLPPLIRVVGHWIPEELFMVTIGVLAANSASASTAATILGAALLSHFVTDQVVYLGGRWLRPRLERFPRIEARLASVTAKLAESPEWFVSHGRVSPRSTSLRSSSISRSGQGSAGGSPAI